MRIVANLGGATPGTAIHGAATSGGAIRGRATHGAATPLQGTIRSAAAHAGGRAVAVAVQGPVTREPVGPEGVDSVPRKCPTGAPRSCPQWDPCHFP